MMKSFNDRAFVVSHLIVPLALMIPILIGFELTNWDVDFQRLLYYPDTDTWLISKRGWAEVWLHDRSKTLTHIYANFCILGLILSFWKERFKPYRRDFLFLIVAVALATGVVAGLKQVTYIWCPSQTTLFGGENTYVKIFEPRIWADGQGICWPAGHASAGFAFLSAYFVVRRRWPRYAMWALLGGLAMGTFYGSVRMMQGLHFLSHMFWTAIICWVIMVLLAMVMFREPKSIPVSKEQGATIP